MIAHALVDIPRLGLLRDLQLMRLHAYQAIVAIEPELGRRTGVHDVTTTRSFAHHCNGRVLVFLQVVERIDDEQPS